MPGNKTVIISCNGETLKFLHVTEAKISEELDSDIVKTFDEPVAVPSSDGGYTVDISALETRSVEDFIALKRILKLMKHNKGELTITEDVKYRDGTFLAENYLGGVTLTSNEVSYDAEDLTARDLSFNAESLREVVNGQEITVD